MPFLHWFKRTPANKGIEADIGQKAVKEMPPAPEPLSVDAPATVSRAEEDSPGPEQTIGLTRCQEASAVSEPVVNPTEEAPASPNLSVPIGSFYAELPSHLLVGKEPDFGRYVQIAQEDVLIDEEAQQATVPLSILSLSCPEIFLRPVDSSDEIPITFSLRYQDLPKAGPGNSLPDSKESTTSAGMPELHTGVTPARGDGELVKLRLQPILDDFPPALGLPKIQSMALHEAEIPLPLDILMAQLPNGRVAIPAQTFIASLPDEMKPLFAGIDLKSEIPIPLQEVFARLPADVTETRKDQELDRPDVPVITPFSEHVREDSQRFKEPSGEAAPQADEQQRAIEPPMSGTDAAAAAARLQAIFMTDEPLDLARTIDKIVELPGLQACVLTTTDGLKLAGNIGDPDQEKVITSVFPDVFQQTWSRLEKLSSGPLEGLTLYCASKQFSSFVRDNLCLTIVHSDRPFKPGVREKIQIVLQEIQALSPAHKPN